MKETKKIRVGIVVLNYNGWEDTINCIRSLYNLTYRNFDICVVDNDSPDGSINYIRKWLSGGLDITLPDNLDEKIASCIEKELSFPIEYEYIEKNVLSHFPGCKDRSLTLIKSSKNGGFSYGNNLGISYLLKNKNVDCLWVINNDTVCEKDSLTHLVNYYKGESNSRTGIISSKLKYYYSPDIIQACGGVYNSTLSTSKHIGDGEKDIGQYDNDLVIKKADYPVGASMFVGKDYIEDVGYLCEDYFLYYEELDWALRGKEKNWQLGYSFNSVVYHKEGATINGQLQHTGNKSDISDSCYLKNKIRITRKFYPRKIIIVKFLLLYSLVNRVRRKQFKSIKHIFSAFFL